MPGSVLLNEVSSG